MIKIREKLADMACKFYTCTMKTFNRLMTVRSLHIIVRGTRSSLKALTDTRTYGRTSSRWSVEIPGSGNLRIPRWQFMTPGAWLYAYGCGYLFVLTLWCQINWSFCRRAISCCLLIALQQGPSTRRICQLNIRRGGQWAPGWTRQPMPQAYNLDSEPYNTFVNRFRP